jgi:hypothetical protein
MRTILVSFAIIAPTICLAKPPQLKQPRPLERSRFTFVEYRLGDAVLIASQHRAIVPILRQLGGQRDAVGVAAIDIRKGSVLFFENPFRKNDRTGAQGWMCDVVAFSSDTCGIVFYSSEDDTGETPVEVLHWDLKTNVVSSVGQYPLGLFGLFGAVDMSQFKLACSYDKDAKWTGKFELRAKRNPNNSVSLSIDPIPHAAIAEGVYLHPGISFIPGGDPTSFIICKSLCEDNSPVEVTCISPSMTPAEKWRLRKSSLRKVIGVEPYYLGPLLESSPMRGKLLLGYEGKPGAGSGFVSIDKSTGKVLGNYHLKEDESMPTLYGVVSTDGGTIMFRKPDDDCYRFMEVGSWRKYERKLQGSETLTVPFGFVDQHSFLSADSEGVLKWSMENGEWRSRTLFTLPNPIAVPAPPSP